MSKNQPKQFHNTLQLRRSAMDEAPLRACSEKIETCLQKGYDIPQLTEAIKEELEKNQNGYGWNVVIGKDFGSHIFHRSKFFANFHVGELEIIIWRSQLKYFSFKVSRGSQIKKIYHQNLVYQGQVKQTEDGYAKEGLGIIFTVKGECYFGEFKDNKINGEGNYFLRNGNFLRGTFVNNKLDGKAIYVKREGDIYILNFCQGILNGPCTYFAADSSYAVVVNFEYNNFKNIIKKYHFSKQSYAESKILIIKKIFEDSQNSEILCTSKDIENILSKQTDSSNYYISSHLLYSSHLYCGIIDKDMVFNGVGILIDFQGEIKAGEFKNCKLQNYGITIDKSFYFLGGFNNDKSDKNVLVYSFKKNMHKLCNYNTGQLEKVIEQNEGEYQKNVFDYSEITQSQFDEEEFQDVIIEPYMWIIINIENLEFDNPIVKQQQNSSKKLLQKQISFQQQKDFSDVSNKNTLEQISEKNEEDDEKKHQQFFDSNTRAAETHNIQNSNKNKLQNKNITSDTQELTKIFEVEETQNLDTIINTTQTFPERQPKSPLKRHQKEKKRKDSSKKQFTKHQIKCWDFNEQNLQNKKQVRENYFKNKNTY